MILLTEDFLENEFDRATLTRGQSYQQRGHVKELSMSDSEDGDLLIKARVQGSRRVPYQVSLELDVLNDVLSLYGECTCPMSYDCKHIAAVLYEVMDKDLLQSWLIAPRPYQQTKVDEVESILNQIASKSQVASNAEFDKWVGLLDSTLKTPKSSVISKNDDYQLLYILENESTHLNSLTIKLLVAKKLKKGGFGNLFREFTHSSNTHLKSLKPVDQDILHRLEVANRISNPYDHDLYHNKYDLIVDVNHVLLSDIIKTGRCYWEKHQQSLPLQLGPSQQGSLTWQIEEDGTQKLVCEVGGKKVKLLPLTPLWYIEPESYLCGPLEMELESKLVNTLLLSPPLPPHDIPKMEQIVREKLKKSAEIPLPYHFKTTELKTLKPKPKLFLFGMLSDHPIFYRNFGRAADLPLGRVSFFYEDVEVPIADGVTINSVDKPSRSMRVISRDITAEAEWIKVLLESGPAIFAKRYPTVQMYHLKPLDFLVAPPEDDTAQEAFLTQILPTLQAAGWTIVIDKSFPLEYIATVDDWYTDMRETSEFDWFSMEIGFLLNGKKVNILPLLVRLIEQHPEQFSEKYLNSLTSDTCVVPLPNGHKVAVPVARVKGILATVTELYDSKSLDTAGLLPVSHMRAAQLLELKQAMAVTSIRWLGSEKLKQLSEHLTDFKGIIPVEIPTQFKGKLRDYQKTGVDWLNFLREYHLGGILSDDMGLGKTIQTLAHLLVEKHSGRMKKPCLIVAPTSLMENWRSEAALFSPSLTVLVLQGQDRKGLADSIGKVDIVLTTYPLIVRDKDTFLEQDYYMVILDEAQFAKNSNTKAYTILQQIRTSHRLCLTGTPIENHLGELWSLFNFLCPGLLGDSKQFTRIFRTPIEKHDNSFRRQILNQRVKPYLLRRTKEEVVLELPPKTEVIHNIVIEEAQRDLYESIRLAMEAKVQKAIQAKGFASSQIIILDALLKLRQVCCDPRLLKLEQAKKVQTSAKLNFLMDMLVELLNESRKILIFSSFTSMLTLIEEALQQQNMQYVKLTGSTIDRKTPIQQFQNSEVPIFLISLKAGGTGLNLTAADTVIHYDPWWNPAAEAQATDRAHRIGQTKPVFVYKLVTTGTVEEKILKMQDKKRALMESLFDETQGTKAGKISAADLQFLFKPLEDIEAEKDAI